MNDRSEPMLPVCNHETRRAANPIETAEAIRALQERGMTRRETEEHFHLSKAHVNTLLRLLHLPAQLRSDVRNGRLPLAKARTLAGLQELGLPDEELHALMRKFASESTPEETCTAFNRRIQEYKAERLGRPRADRRQELDTGIKRIEAQVQKLMRALQDGTAHRNNATDFAAILRPLHGTIAVILKQPQANGSPPESEGQNEQGQ